jgi:hypothetical protein
MAVGASARSVRYLVTRLTGMNGQRTLNQFLDDSWFCMILHVTLTLGDGARHQWPHRPFLPTVAMRASQ